MQAGTVNELAGGCAGPAHRCVLRRHLAGGFHPGRRRPFSGNGRAFGDGRIGRIPVLSLPITVLLGLLRLHLLCTAHGLPVRFALTGAKADKGQSLLNILSEDEMMNRVQADGHRQLLIRDKNYYGRDFEWTLDASGIQLLRPAHLGEELRAGATFYKPLSQIIVSVNESLKARLDLERHGGRVPSGVAAQVVQRLLALTIAVWHNE